MTGFTDFNTAIKAGIDKVKQDYPDAALVKVYGGTTSATTASNPAGIKNLIIQFKLPRDEAVIIKSMNFEAWGSPVKSASEITNKPIAWPVRLSLSEAWAVKIKAGYSGHVSEMHLIYPSDTADSEPVYRFLESDYGHVTVGSMTGAVVPKENDYTDFSVAVTAVVDGAKAMYQDVHFLSVKGTTTDGKPVGNTSGLKDLSASFSVAGSIHVVGTSKGRKTWVYADSAAPIPAARGIDWPVKVSLIKAVELKKTAGYEFPFRSVTLFFARAPGVTEPTFLFEGTTQSVTVGTTTGMVVLS